jgi:multidrug efflux pump subunit AcrA (membrane-fusion protein)
MQRDVDLAALSRKVVERPPRRKLRVVVPLVLIVGFGALLFSTLGDFLKGAVEVTVVRPQAAEGVAAGSGGGGATLQRSGWIEPDPFPIHATALVPGIVKEVVVLEAATVHPGDPVALLVDDVAKLDVTTAQAALARAQAELQKAAAERDNAHASFDAALEITEQVATAHADAAARHAEADKRAAAAVEAKARVRIATEELAVQRYLAERGGAGPRQVELAEAKVDAEQAALAQMEADAALARAEAEKSAARSVRADRDKELRLSEKLRVQTADAALAAAQATVADAQAAQARAQLTLDRMTVRVPAFVDPALPQTPARSLVVSQRLVTTGAAVGGEGRESVCTLFDPDHLRVRVDVEQSEVRKLAIGQKAQVKAPTRPDRLYDGEITRIVAQANVEKVTLQVHVKIADPDAALRPELLVEVRFLAESAAKSGDGTAAPAADGTRDNLSGAAVWIPARLVDSNGGNAVWIVDAASGRAARRPVEVGARDGERIVVTRGLNVADKLIDGGRERLTDGARLKIAASNPEGGR